MRKIINQAVLLLTLTSGAMLAHEAFEVIGTVTKITSDELDVKTRDGKLVSMGVGAQTSVKKYEQNSSLAGIKKGQNVIVTAFGDSYDDLGALEIKIVAKLTKGPRRLTPAPGKQK